MNRTLEVLLYGVLVMAVYHFKGILSAMIAVFLLLAFTLIEIRDVLKDWSKK
jgi:hypothetical protein